MKNQLRQKEIEKAKIKIESEEVEKKIDIKDYATQMRETNIQATNEIKQQGIILTEKLQKTKKDQFYEVQDDFKTEYLAILKDMKEDFVQCEIWEKPDLKALMNEQAEKSKKKEKPKAIQKLVRQLLKGSFMQSVIEKQSFSEIKEQNEKKKVEILRDKQIELIDFLNENRISLFENVLENLVKYDTFKSYYDDCNTGEMDLKRTWISNYTEVSEESIVNKRSVTNIEFTSYSQELLLATYSSEYDNPSSVDPNGLIILHNIHKKQPELVLKHQTEFTSTCFHSGNPKLIMAGTFTGQILVYDVRVGSTPILKTPSSGKYHSLPIYSINNFGADNSNQIVSTSNDGMICIFNISNFSRALKKIEIKRTVENKYSNIVTQEEIGVITSAIRPNSEYLYLGSDDSDIYQVYLGTK